MSRIKNNKELAKKFSELAKDLKRARPSPVITSPLSSSTSTSTPTPLTDDLMYDAAKNKWYKKHNYEEIEKLGSGQFGVTSLVRDLNTGKNFVLKAIKLNRVNIKDVYSEIDILKRISKHGCKANLLCFVDYYIDYDTQIIYIVTDVFKNSITLAKFIHRYQISGITIDVYTLLKIMKELLKALVYLHKIGIAHADIKPENILIDEDLRVQIIDFGISCTKNCSVTGTLLYQSPELIRLIGSTKRQRVDVLKRGDIFSLGMVFYLLANLKFPFPLESEYILNTKAEYPPNYPVVKLNAASAIFMLNNFYVKIGGFLTPQDRKRYKEMGKQEPENLITSSYGTDVTEGVERADINKSINNLILKMIGTDVEKRPLAKHCMSILNKIIKQYNNIQRGIIMTPGIESPEFITELV